MSRYTPKRWHKRRHRKLFRLGEFAEYGFQVAATAPTLWPHALITRQVDDFLAALARHSLAFDGLSEPVIQGAVTSAVHRQSATDLDRDFVAQLLVELGFSSVVVGALHDAWYPPQPPPAAVATLPPRPVPALWQQQERAAAS